MQLRETYKKGLEWTEPRLIEEARSALPPLNPYYDLDEDLVKTGNWRQSVQNSFDLGGYQNFIPDSLKSKRKVGVSESLVGNNDQQHYRVHS